jgi:hypothetical protein
MELEYTFNGTPEQFMEVAMVYIARRTIKKEPYQWRISGEGYHFLYLRDVEKGENARAWIKAQVLPGNQTLLLVFLQDVKLYALNPFWELFYDELIKQGWITSEVIVVIKKPREPQKPPVGASLDVWFVYYHAMKVAGRKYTLKQLSKDAGYDYGHVRKHHTLWKISSKNK